MRFFFLFLWSCLSFLVFGDAPSENRIRVGLAGYPTSNLIYLGYDDYSEAVTSLVLEPLVRLNEDTLQAEPALAKRFSQNDRGTRFEFELNPRAKFSDGSPVTLEDVQYTWKVLKSPEALIQAYASQFQNLVTCELSGSKIIFLSHSPIPAGLSLFSKFYVLPKKTFSVGSLTADFNDTFMGSGPYVFKKVTWGHSVLLNKNPGYWARTEPALKDRYLLEQIEFHTQSDPAILFQMLLKNEIDYLYFLSAKSWAVDTAHPLFKEGKIQKLEVKNKTPFAMAGIAWNLRKPLFQNKHIRKALALLFNRSRLIHDFFYDQYALSTGIAPFASEFHHPENQPILFDPTQAQKLLAQAGWKLNSKKVLERQGQTFTFEILTGNPPAAKYLAFYQEDLRKAGIVASIRVVDWATYLKLRNSGTFDALDFSRNRDEFMTDLDLTWNGKNASDPQSGNVTGFSHPQVDALLSTLAKTVSGRDRIKLIQSLDKLIADEYPIAFSWEPRFQRIAFWNQYLFNGKGYYNYSRWNQLFHDWRWKPQKKD